MLNPEDLARTVQLEIETENARSKWTARWHEEHLAHDTAPSKHTHPILRRLRKQSAS